MDCFSPCLLGSQIQRKGGSRYLLRNLLARIQLLRRVDSTVLVISQWAPSKMSLECETHFLDRREAIPGLDGLSKTSGLVKDILGLGDRLRVRIGKF